LRHLTRYVDLLCNADDGLDPALTDHVETTLTDLIGLVIGARRDFIEIACKRGLRSARIQEILAEIKSGFADPAISPQTVAVKLGLSARYLQDLLQETGKTFTDRVLELRLERAGKLLAHARYDRMKIADIAFACGFNEASYFNRCFRRRFGESPLAFRHTANTKKMP
jgi:transcriptional regulator GlxA family with amidase domain